MSNSGSVLFISAACSSTPRPKPLISSLRACYGRPGGLARGNEVLSCILAQEMSPPGASITTILLIPVSNLQNNMQTSHKTSY